ncbi:MAG: hypothetical protein KF724_08030 [Phycisphaeraceae bacterium]|nr:hypothetical protein [Phycisphaeraceae bacterium]
MFISTLIAISMVAVGILVWRALRRQEEGDTVLQRRFKADDRRAKAARERTSRDS